MNWLLHLARRLKQPTNQWTLYFPNCKRCDELVREHWAVKEFLKG